MIQTFVSVLLNYIVLQHDWVAIKKENVSIQGRQILDTFRYKYEEAAAKYSNVNNFNYWQSQECVRENKGYISFVYLVFRSTLLRETYQKI